jgi:hypothetical protein
MFDTTMARSFPRARLDRALAELRRDPADILILAVRHRLVVGVVVFAVASALTLDDALYQGHAWALFALLAVPAALLLRGRPRLAGLALVAGGVLLRLSLAGVWQADPVAVTVAAGQAALNGYDPYGHGYAAAVPPGAPFPYGPLALIWNLPGQIVESAASVATMLLFVLTGSWITLGLYAADSFAVHSATQGVNDLSPGLLIAVGLLALRKRPVIGGLILAMAAAIKPYAFAWFPAAVGYAGLPALLGLAGGSLVLWSPLVDWGLTSYLKSVAMARAVHAFPNALNIPELRVLGIPIAIAGLWVRRWDVMVALGTVVFTVVLFFDHWASKGYWLAVLPIVGIAAEAWVVRRAPTLVRFLRTRPAFVPSLAPRTATTERAALDQARMSSPVSGLAPASLATQPIGNDDEDAHAQASGDATADVAPEIAARSDDWRVRP